MTWEQVFAQGPDDPPEVLLFTLVFLVVSYIGYAVLWWFISWHRSKRAGWLLLTVTSLAFIAVLLMFDDPADLRPQCWRIVELVSVALGLAAVACLFTLSARQWFATPRQPLEDIFA